MSRKLLIVGIFALLLGAFIIPVAAFTGGEITAVRVTCTDFSLGYNAMGVNRNNLGVTGPGYENGVEASRLYIADGAGITLLDSLAYNIVGTTIGAHTDDTFPYSTAPTMNPIRLQLFSLAGNGFDLQLQWDATGDCVGLPTAPTPPGGLDFSPRYSIPSNFVHRKIECETPVYNLPGGQPIVGGATIHNGQTWFVHPDTVEAFDGSVWREIFTSGRVNGYIPNSCVNPDPAAVVIKF